MKALFPTTDESVILKEVEVPPIESGDLLIAMRSCGICGTDLEKVKGEASTPCVLGHEVVGEVVKVGDNVRAFSEGDRVFSHHHVSCGKCVYCLQGSETMCQWFTDTNLDPCGFSELFKVPSRNVDQGSTMKIPDSLDFDKATFIEPLGCCIRAASRSRLKAGCTVAVVGCGPMGILNLMVAKAFGASKLVAIEVSDFRLSWAVKMGADLVVNPLENNASEMVKKFTGGMGVDLVILATSNPRAFTESFNIVRRGGSICLFGAPEKDLRVQINLAKIFYDEISIMSTYSTTENETSTALKMLESKLIQPQDLITHRYDISDASNAFRAATNASESMKVVVTSRAR